MTSWRLGRPRQPSPRRLGTMCAVGAAAVLGAGAAMMLRFGATWTGEERAREAELAKGRMLYQQHCARCHGANLQGQSNWQRRLPSGRLPAPPHDASGHTWHHSDRILFEITKKGTAAVVGGGHESDMPGFAGVLADDEVRAVLAFIKSTWPERERRFQERVSTADREAQ